MKKLVLYFFLITLYVIQVTPTLALQQAAFARVDWIIEPGLNGDIKLTGLPKSVIDAPKISIICVPSIKSSSPTKPDMPKLIYLYFHFEDQGMKKRILNAQKVYLVIDDDEINYNGYAITKAKSTFHLIGGAYVLPDPVLDLMQSAKRIGFKLQDNVNPIITYGPENFNFDQGRELLKGLRDICK